LVQTDPVGLGSSPADVARARRGLAAEVLRTAAEHSALTDELHELRARCDGRAWTAEERTRYDELSAQLLEARYRHDQASLRLRRLSTSQGRLSVQPTKPSIG
jgi:hypothetical protein